MSVREDGLRLGTEEEMTAMLSPLSSVGPQQQAVHVAAAAGHRRAAAGDGLHAAPDLQSAGSNGSVKVLNTFPQIQPFTDLMSSEIGRHIFFTTLHLGFKTLSANQFPQFSLSFGR